MKSMKNQLKVLFLDIDGVLVTPRSMLAFKGAEAFDPVSCSLIDELCKRSDAKIVICSSWREDVDRECMAKIIESHGISSKHLHIDWATPILTENQAAGVKLKRQDEINQWLSLHPTVRRWAIIDDGIGLDEASPYLVQPSFDDGISFDNILKLMAILDVDIKAWFDGAGVKFTASDELAIEAIKNSKFLIKRQYLCNLKVC